MGVRGRQPLGKKSGGPGAAAPGIEDFSFIADIFVSGVVVAMDSIGPDGSPAFIGSHNQPGDEPL